jgi:hypothetical protein
MGETRLTKKSKVVSNTKASESVAALSAGKSQNGQRESGKLRSTDSGKILTMETLQKAITHFEKTHLDDINFEANPLLLMPTEKRLCPSWSQSGRVRL